MTTLCSLYDSGSKKSEQDKKKNMKSCQFEGGGLPTVHVHRVAVIRRSVGGSHGVQTWTRRRTEAVLWRVQLKSVSFCFSFAAVHECY